MTNCQKSFILEKTESLCQMIVITKLTTKSELLKEMANQLMAPDNSLHLDVEFLPNFLNTVVAFTIFNYQISNFPKPVFWLSYDAQIVHFLHNCQASFPPNFLAAQQPLLTTQTPEFSKEYLSLVSQEFENTQNIATDLQAFEPSNLEELDFEGVKTEEIEPIIPKIKSVESFFENSEQVSDFTNKQNSFIDFAKVNPKKPNLNLQQEFQQEFANQRQQVRKKIDFNFPISEQLKNISEYESLSTKNLFRQNRYNRSSLIQGGRLGKAENSQQNWFSSPVKIWQNIWQKKNSDSDLFSNNNFINPQPEIQKNRNSNQRDSSANFVVNQNQKSENFHNFSDQNSQNINQFGGEISKESSFYQKFAQNQNSQNSQKQPKNQALNKSKNSIPEKIPNSKVSKIRFHKDIFANFNQNRFSQFWSHLWNNLFGGSWLKKSILMAGSASFGIAILIFFFFVSFFPTQAYTLEISPVQSTSVVEFELNLQQFETKNLILESQVQTIPSGKENIQLPKAVGKVQLINRANSPIFLTNGGFLLISKERVYFQLPSGNSGTITIPANNVSKPLEVQIEAENKGENYNLPIGETLSITNLKGEGVCDNCFAKTVEEIKNTKPNPANIISENDKKSLLEKANLEISDKIDIEVENMNKNGNLSDKNWLKTLDKTQTFIGETGKPASELKLTTKSNLNLFGLKNNQIFRLLKEKNDKIFQANNFQIVSSSGWDSESKIVKVKISYNFSQYENLSTDEILEELSQKPVNEVQKKFQAKYSGLRAIQKEEKGLKVPGITPRINIDIIKNNKVDVNN